MTAQNYFTRLKYIDQLIQDEMTGRPVELAEKVEVSERMIYRYIQNMKDMGAPLAYSIEKNSYIYTDRVSLKVEICYEKRKRIYRRK